MDEKILRETFDHNLNESFRLKQLENGLSVFTVIKTTQTNLVTKSMEKTIVCPYSGNKPLQFEMKPH